MSSGHGRQPNVNTGSLDIHDQSHAFLLLCELTLPVNEVAKNLKVFIKELVVVQFILSLNNIFLCFWVE